MFRKGDKVVALKSWSPWRGDGSIVIGEIYTVTGIIDEPFSRLVLEGFTAQFPNRCFKLYTVIDALSDRMEDA